MSDYCRDAGKDAASGYYTRYNPSNSETIAQGVDVAICKVSGNSVWAYFEQFDEALHKSLNIFGLEKIWVGQEVIFHKSKGHAVLT